MRAEGFRGRVFVVVMGVWMSYLVWWFESRRVVVIIMVVIVIDGVNYRVFLDTDVFFFGDWGCLYYCFCFINIVGGIIVCY
jgi:hypothetical protein